MASRSLVVAWYRKRDGTMHYLTGLESKYGGYHPLPEVGEGETLEDLIRERIPADTRFVIRTRRTNGERSYTIQKPESDSKYGFPKGGSKPEDDNDLKKTALREFKEEIGYDIPSDELEYVKIIGDYAVYTFHVDYDTKQRIERVIREMTEKKEGELFEAAFRSNHVLKRNRGDYNKVSRDSFDMMESMYPSPRRTTQRRRSVSRRRNPL